MKRLHLVILFLAVLGLNACIKNDPVVYDDTVIEFDAAIWNANAAGKTYPILTRLPAQGVATGSSQPALTRTSGTVQLRINLVGPQRSAPTNFSYVVAIHESTAVQGVHFAPVSGTGTIPANSSFGTISIDILNPGASSGSRILVLDLVDSADPKVSPNYYRVGLSISQS